ncbi:MAG: major capsid protein [Alphaproteobacteria bacterium]|nr:major capsid protein [Alphaproteobacteria bacterium]
MATFDIFNNDAFSMISMIEAIDKVPYKPSLLGDLNLFAPKPVTTRNVYVEERNGVLSLVQTTPRGAPLPQRTTEKRSMRSFDTVRIAKADHMNASEIQGVRAFGSETELMMMQKELMRRMAGPVGLQSDIELTWEHMRLGAVQGIVLDADGSVITNWYDEFGITQPAEIAFDLTGANAASSDVNGATKLKKFIAQKIVRPMQRAAKGAFTPQSEVVALCGDDFYDDLTSHGDVARAYGNWLANQPSSESNAFGKFRWGGVTWINYRGTDDNSTIAIDPDEAKFFPASAPGIFINAWSPGEFFDVVNTPGIPLLPKIVPDPTVRQQYVDIELYSYPLMICTRPEVLLRGKRGAA